MGAIHYGPSGVPLRDDPDAAVELLVAGGYSACEIDFEGGFWMEWDWAAAFGRAARDNDIVLVPHLAISLEQVREDDAALGRHGHAPNG